MSKSIIEDFAAIGKALREAELKANPVKVNSPECLCTGRGWIGIRRSGYWYPMVCPECQNPARKVRPTS